MPLPSAEMATIRLQFFEECAEHRADLERGLLALQAGEIDPEIINAIFRSVHSVKGGAGIFAMEALVGFSHGMETALAGYRSSGVLPDAPALKVLLRAADVLADLIDAAREGRTVEDGRATASAAELSALHLRDRTAPAPAEEDGFEGLDFTPQPVSFDDLAETAPTERAWVIRFRPWADLYRKANEPAALLRELQRLGSLVVTLDDSAVPLLSELQPEEACLGWTLRLSTDHGAEAIREVFEFVEGDCDLEIAAENESGPQTLALDTRSVSAVGEPPAAPSAAPPPLGGGPAATASAAIDPPAPTIRVDLDRVDRLIDLVSELVIGEATLGEQIGLVLGPDVARVAGAMDDLRQLTRDLQEAVMAIRAQPVKSLFQRMSRLVREVELATGKTARLVAEGEETEVDRAVIERLTDPLTHMIRNAIDHGLESPADRRLRGKPEQGTVRLCAGHRAGRILIEVSDDGAGIDRERVRAIAIERGLIGPEESLGDDEIENLIFAPGFSTAAAVSDLSGRGVGMDVVRRSVQALGGRISVSSRPGEGSTFSLSLPLTLAVMDGMLVTVAGQCLVAPMTALLETVSLASCEVRRLGPSASVMAIRGSYVPLVDLSAILNYPGGGQAAQGGVALLVEDDAGERIALRVDEIVDQRQVVIKSLEANYRALKGIGAATILGDGRVALILDVNAIVASQRTRVLAESPAAHLQALHA